ncbi:hypothetical protein J2S45_000744 [Trueperella abortisuis]|uniref:Integrase n=1 Tax=Trueperella abortisuis TaxID=445930 RepID=A0ABT9PIT4_9ACTO|nr:hypothetical protein [Trueperella abortisuis]
MGRSNFGHVYKTNAGTWRGRYRKEGYDYRMPSVCRTTVACLLLREIHSRFIRGEWSLPRTMVSLDSILS